MTNSHSENEPIISTPKISHRKVPRILSKEGGDGITLTDLKNGIEAKFERFSDSGEGWVEIAFPVFTVSEANGGVKTPVKRKGKTILKAEHWSEKHRRHKLQKGSVALMLRPLRKNLSMPCTIHLTRYAPVKLDRFDNLPMSLKWILDSVCEIITDDYLPGRADSHEGITNVVYDQVVSKQYGVKIRIEFAN